MNIHDNEIQTLEEILIYELTIISRNHEHMLARIEQAVCRTRNQHMTWTHI